MPTFEDNNLEKEFTYDGVTQFNRVSSFFRVSIIEQDALANAVNIDINQGSAATRRGIEAVGAGLPTSRVQGIGFLDTASPSVQQVLFAIINGAPYKWDGTSWTLLIGYAAPNNSQRVTVVPLVDRIYLATSGSNIFSWDGTTFTDLGSGTNKPKQYSILCAHTYRLFGAGLPGLPDTLECSDILDGGTWMQLTNSSRVGGGESDPITALCRWTDYNLIVGKRNSIWLVNADPTVAPGNWAMKEIVPEIGCVGQATMCQVGDDVLWLSRDGVHSMSLTLQGLTQGVPVEPLTRPIEDIIDRINWNYVHLASARFWAGRYILSVPLDTATDCNAVLVYNALTKGWCGIWTGWNATGFIPTFFNNQARLVMGRDDGTVAQWMDYVSDTNESASNFEDMSADYPSSCDTRGMNCNEGISPKQGFSGEIEFWKSLANANVNVKLDGGDWTPFWSGDTQGATGSKIGNALPWTLNVRTFWRIARDLIRFGSWRELQFQVSTTAGKLQLRSVYMAAHLEKFDGEKN